MSRMKVFAVKVVVNAVAIWVATLVVSGISVTGRATEGAAGQVLTYLVVGQNSSIRRPSEMRLDNHAVSSSISAFTTKVSKPRVST